VAQGGTLIDRGVADRSGWSREAVGATETRRLAAILAADVAGYSRLMGADEPGTLQRLRAIRAEVIDPTVATHSGRIVKTTGDGLLVEFGSTVDALCCATEVQAAMAERNARAVADSRIVFRIGIHQGDITAEEDDIFGDAVNIAARLEALAEPGGICVSARVQEDAAGKLDLGFRDLGEQRLHNITRPVHAYAIGRRARSPKKPRRADVQSRPLTRRAAPRPAPPLSLVVLPFANLSNDPEQEYFADGITDDLTTDLSRLSESFVIARNTAFTYKGKPTDVKQIGRDLGVRYVVEGSVRRTGDQVQVNVQLIDAESGVHLWADRFDTDRRDLAKAQAEIIFRLARSLDVKLVAAEATRREQHRAVDPSARDFEMRGRNLIYQPDSPTKFREAQQAFERALEVDPASNEARIGLATVLGIAVTDAAGYGSQDLQRAEQLALEAIERDPNNSRAHVALGRVRLGQKNRLREAQIELETALALDRNNLGAVRQLTALYAILGEPEAGISEAEKALRLSPLDSNVWNSQALTGICQAYLNHVDLAIDYLAKARAAAPRIWWIHFYLAGALGLKGDLDAGRASLSEGLRLKPEMNSVAQFRDLKPWYGSPKMLQLEEHTVMEGLRRLGFPGT
jgi:TolB-like protein/class 3 adenylate cyclase